MMSLRHNLLGSALFLAAILPGCGGHSRSDETHDADGRCEYDGQSYEPGSSFPAADGCNSCFCDENGGGSVSCTLVDCQPGCEYGGSVYAIGDAFPNGDGCNTCTCTAEGVACTTIACNRCSTLESEYGVASDEARQCDPTLDDDECTQAVTIGLVCGCPSFVNRAASEAIDRLSVISAEYHAANCRPSGIACGACLEPTGGHCSLAGRCEDVPP